MRRTLTYLLAGALPWLAVFSTFFTTAQAQQAGAGGGGPPYRPWPLPNILVIVADDVGWRDLSPSIPTPNIDALARAGVSFQRAYAQPYCSPSRFSILFGLQPFREQLGTYIDPNLPGEVSVSRTRLALPRVLKAYGYGTLATGKWHLSTFAIGVPAAWDWPRAFGFQAFRAGRLGNIGQTVRYDWWPRIDDGVQRQTSEYNTSAIRRATTEWWLARGGPKFAYVAFHAPHAPYHVPPATLLPTEYAVGPSNRSRYEAMLVALDTEVGNLLASVDMENTVVVFLGDNGTPSDALAPGQDASRVKGSVYEDGIRVPLIVAGAGVVRGRKCESLVSITDLFATLLEHAHVPLPPGHAIDSVSFAKQLVRPELSSRAWVYAQKFAPNGSAPKTCNQRAVISRRFKFVTDGAQEFLFDLFRDPGERSPLPVGERVYVRQALRSVMDAMRTQGAP